VADEETRLTREELYERVWTKPTTKVAKELGISDVALAKICTKLNVPKPPLGYWRQVEVGQRVRKPPLPKASRTGRNEIWIRATEKKIQVDTQDPALAELLKFERDPANKIIVRDSLRNAHPLVAQTRDALANGRTDEYGRVWPDHPKGHHLDIRVSKNCLRRALLILNALLKGLESRGFSIEPAKDGWRTTRIIAGGVEVRFYLMEKVDRSERVASPKEKKEHYGYQPRWLFTPTGKLIFAIDTYQDVGKKRWADKKATPLEQQLNDVVIGVLTAAAASRVEEARRKEEERRRADEQRRREELARIQAEEEKRQAALELEVDLWTTSRNILAFLEACEEAIAGRFGPVEPDSREGNWLLWARTYANRLNPLKNGRLERAINSWKVSA
jgi:hypothetical protein